MVIPKFKTEKEEAKWWDKHADAATQMLLHQALERERAAT
jgi:hypothetical protein